MYEVLIAILVFVIIYLLYINNSYKNQPAPITVPMPLTTAATQPQIIVVDTTPIAPIAPIAPITTYSSWYEGNYVPWRWRRPYGYRGGYRGGWGRRRGPSA
jgi:hypothetical protein